MYRDVGQWLAIRHQILVRGIPIRRIARETAIDQKTIRKMRDQPLPLPYGPRSHRYPKLGPYTASVQQMLKENATLSPSARCSIQTIYERIRGDGFRGGYSAVSDYVRPIQRVGERGWKYVYDMLRSLEKTRAIEFPLLLSRADPPVILGGARGAVLSPCESCGQRHS